MPLEGRMNNFEFIKADDTCELTSWRIVKPYNWHTTDGRWAPFLPPLVSNFERDKMSCYDDMNDRGGKKSRVHVTHARAHAHAHAPDLSENSRMRAHASIVPALLAVSLTQSLPARRRISAAAAVPHTNSAAFLELIKSGQLACQPRAQPAP